MFSRISRFFTIITLLLAAKLFFPYHITEQFYPYFRVVLDPGHGGISLRPKDKHGDRYDVLTGKYLDAYREGATYKKVSEHVVTYEIAEKVDDILSLTRTSQGFKKFKSILKKFGVENPERIVIQSFLSRGDSRDRGELEELDDPNGEFRLFDYRGSDGSIKPGRISRINSFKPHLVVSLHCDRRSPRDRKGFTPVIAPSYYFFYKGFLNLKKTTSDRKFFYDGHYSSWFLTSTKRSTYFWFMNDTSSYFTGYTIKKNLSIDKSNFRGYKYNMVTWNYSDEPGWEDIALSHPSFSQYSADFKSYIPKGRFWERERSKYEEFRRDKGIEGYGGDNLYASNEIIRYILTSLHIDEEDHKLQKMAAPYPSEWALPMLVNAITAYIELGDLYESRFRYLLTKKQDEIAEGIAVGVYSLVTGIKVDIDYKYKPKGEKIDFDKYKIDERRYYFDEVVPEIGGQ